MSETKLGKIDLTEKQLARLSEAHLNGVNGFTVIDGEVIVHHEKDELTKSEIDQIVTDLKAIQNDDTPDKKRLEDLRKKPTLTLQEVTEVLRIHKLV